MFTFCRKKYDMINVKEKIRKRSYLGGRNEDEEK